MTEQEPKNTELIEADEGTSIVPNVYLSPEQHPVVAYLASLKPSGRRTQERALDQGVRPLREISKMKSRGLS